jgi:uncharacterized membrane protein YcgQ (UPF0703/DUF1980 family)
MPVEFKRLYDSVAKDAAEEREQYENQYVEVRGKIAINPEDPRFFQIVQFLGSCCAADAQRLPILCASKEPITKLKSDLWVKVQGKVQYVHGESGYHVRILVAGADKVMRCPDGPPYIPR